MSFRTMLALTTTLAPIVFCLPAVAATITYSSGSTRTTPIILTDDSTILSVSGFQGDSARPITRQTGIISEVGGPRALEVTGSDGKGLIFTANNTYTGLTTVRGNGLQIGDGGTTGDIKGDIALASTSSVLYFDRSDAYTYAGTISGTGQVVILGTGPVTLTGSNTYTGGIAIRTGATLSITDASGLSLTMAPASFANGFVRFDGTVSINRSTAFSLTNSAIGSGTLTVSGTGLVTLPGMAVRNVSVATGSTVLFLNAGGVGWAHGTGESTQFTNNGTVIIRNTSSTGTAVASHISGTGSLQIEGGTTTVELLGDNSYTGNTSVSSGTLILGGLIAYDASRLSVASGATLQVGNSAGGSRGAITGNLNINGDLIFNRGENLVYSGNITGGAGTDVRFVNTGVMILAGNNSYGGSLTVDSVGRLVLTADNNPGGGTSVSRANLRIGNDGTTGSLTGNISNGGVVEFSRSNTYVFSGVISGTGDVHQLGSGTTILTGDNSYGTANRLISTVINAGTLQIGNGGTTGSIRNDVTNDSLLVFNRSNSITYSSRIVGTGSMIQAGTGTLIFNGVASYSGATLVNAGTLLVGDASNSGATIAGSGVIVASGAALGGFGLISTSVTNNGTVSPGASIGTLTVNSFAQGPSGTLAIEISPTSSDRLHVLGAASLDGTLQITTIGLSALPQTLTFLDAGSISGQFSNVVINSDSGLAVGGLEYSETTVSLVVAPQSSAQLYTAFNHSSFNTTASLGNALFEHMATQVCRPSIPARAACPEAVVWAQGIGSSGSVNSQGTSSTFTTRFSGVMGGLDYRSDDGIRLGLVASYVTQNLRLTGNQGRVTADTILLAGTAGIELQGGQLDATLFYVASEGSATRPALAVTAKASPKSDGIGAAIQYALPVLRDYVTARARITYIDLTQDAIIETGASPYGVGANQKTGAALFGDFGLMFEHSYTMRSGTVLTPEFSLGARVMASRPSGSIVAYLSDAGGSPFTFTGSQIERTSFTAGLGISAHRRGGLGLYLRADGRIGGSEREGIISVGGSLDL
jgi:autotransporter-associated beta strand protein